MAGERGLQIRLNMGTNPHLVAVFQHAPPDFRYVMEPLRMMAESLLAKVRT